MEKLLEKKRFIYAFGIVFFFALVRYWGYYEDAGRYLLQVVNFLHPERFVDDVPFMFGNQDQFTVFSPVMSIVFKLLGVNMGGIAAMFALRLLWCVGTITLILRWCTLFHCRKWTLPVFIVCMATLINKYYGSGSHFAIIDPILVARYIAFTFSILGLAYFFGKNKFLPLVFFLAASLMHPLIGGWGIPLWLFYHYPKTRALILIVTALFPLTAFLHIGRFDFFPSDWMGESSPFDPTFLDSLIFAGFLVFWLLIGRFAKDKRLSNFSMSMFWVYFAGIFLHYVGIYTHHQFLVQSQPYRVQLFCVVPMFPVFAASVHERTQNANPFPLPKHFQLRPHHSRIIFIIALLFFIVCSALNNFIQLSLEQGVGSTDIALTLMNLPERLLPIQKGLLGTLALICFIQRRYLLTFVFVFSLFNGYATILPLVGMAFYLLGNSISVKIKRLLVVVTLIISFVELLNSLPNSPLLNSSTLSAGFVAMLFGLLFWIALAPKKGTLPTLLVIVAFGIWDFIHWDARDERQAASERQMDVFFDATIFPQIRDRGRILFSVGEELPLQSRFIFLTGTYADQTINIGELFYKGQHLEAMRRKAFLLTEGNPYPAGFDTEKGYQNVYSKPDTLASRARFLCKNKEIIHLVTGHAQMALPKQDSLFLNEMKMPVYLYGCPIF